MCKYMTIPTNASSPLSNNHILLTEFQRCCLVHVDLSLNTVGVEGNLHAKTASVHVG